MSELISTKPMSHAEFAKANSNYGPWRKEGDEVTVYTSDQHRMNISFEIHSSLEYVGRLIGYREEHPVDSAVLFANDLVDAIRGQMSAADVQELMIRLAKELSDWQFEPGCKKPTDLCGDAAKKIALIKGFESTEDQPW